MNDWILNFFAVWRFDRVLCVIKKDLYKFFLSTIYRLLWFLLLFSSFINIYRFKWEWVNDRCRQQRGQENRSMNKLAFNDNESQFWDDVDFFFLSAVFFLAFVWNRFGIDSILIIFQCLKRYDDLKMPKSIQRISFVIPLFVHFILRYFFTFFINGNEIYVSNCQPNILDNMSALLTFSRILFEFIFPKKYTLCICTLHTAIKTLTTTVRCSYFFNRSISFKDKCYAVIQRLILVWTVDQCTDQINTAELVPLLSQPFFNRLFLWYHDMHVVILSEKD